MKYVTFATGAKYHTLAAVDPVLGDKTICGKIIGSVNGVRRYEHYKNGLPKPRIHNRQPDDLNICAACARSLVHLTQTLSQTIDRQ